MSGTFGSTSSVFPTGNAGIDGLLMGVRWSMPTLTYSFPASASEYFYPGESATISRLTASQTAAATAALDTGDANASNDGFSVEGFTGLNVQYTTTSNAQIRVANSQLPPTAWAYGPGTDVAAGDVWLGQYARDPRPGNYSWATTLHEIGHALGLKHPHDFGGLGFVPLAQDSLEFSIMSYRSYVGQPIDPNSGYTNEQYGFPQSYMMLDIAALQAMYGADFTTNSGNTVYTWLPGQGTTYVNSGLGISVPVNRIFATIWDGGGIDTYNLSSYSSSLFVDLRPGGYSLFSGGQLAYLGNGIYARGNIFNALVYQGDGRSLIENVWGGSGTDVIIGNQTNNALVGFAGSDRIYGDSGNDSLIGGAGADFLGGGTGTDYAYYLNASYGVVARLDLPGGNTGDAAGDQYSNIDGLIGSSHGDYLIGDSNANILIGGDGGDVFWGFFGDDNINGQNGNDTLRGNGGTDTLQGGAGADAFVFQSALDPVANVDRILDFQVGVDKIWLDDAIMAAVGALGQLAAGAFLSSTAGTATDVAHRILYNSTTGDLLYDADGSGSGTSVLFANLAGGLSLSVSDFLIV